MEILRKTEPLIGGPAADTPTLPETPTATRSIPWWWAVLLPLPAFIPLANACLMPLLHGLVPTGFVDYDMAYYMANAREHFDQGFHLTYGNPYAGYNTPAVYFQPQTLVLALVEHLGLGPGLTFNLFGLAATVFATWMAILFFREVVGFETTAKRLDFLVFFWGGGLLFVLGLAYAVAHRTHLQGLWKFDPSRGLWMLNFGRNLVYPTEAYYHGLFLLALLCVLRNNATGALAAATVLSMSHPFTGLSLALVLLVYSAFELFVQKRRELTALAAGSALLAAAHLGYYYVFLNRFADHRALQEQWRLPWLYKPSTFIPALCLVGGLVLWRLCGPSQLGWLMGDSRNRLFLTWFLVVFALSHHNLVVKPYQPIHFAHGYDWMALFFLGSPLLVSLFERLLAITSRPFRLAAVVLTLVVLLSDNIAWLGKFLLPDSGKDAVVLTRDQQGVLNWLDRNAAPRAMVVCDDGLINYLVSTYTPVRSWQGHQFNTPSGTLRQAELERFFDRGEVPYGLEGMPLFVVSKRGEKWRPPGDAKQVYGNGGFALWTVRDLFKNLPQNSSN